MTCGGDSEPPSWLGRCLPPAFERRVIMLASGTSRAFEEADWGDALVVLVCGEVDLEGMSGSRQTLRTGAIFWLAGLPLRSIRNIGREPAMLVAVSRRPPAVGPTNSSGDR